ncbi:PREDICTED: condensin complex subunit 2 [Nelumbo nucifera]|uniref:Condensin complex subunit 2 n=2 Tax=Nelumbo nucifera TaxID=4432 RepID=A0A822XJG3_NELNU|nr:PREDICTED: condensin complex subunit 2 [Nelumbo nucifera]DAD20417.1 TPA_asm: hypothetical protein HUJ06_021880 [Nelumbo nucifera]
MAEAIMSPNPPTALRQRAPMASRLQSPTSPFFLGSNDDQLERAQARAARAAAIRRKSIAAAVASAAPPPQSSDLCLGKEQILELFQNCIKLASENKINQKNTWELSLIDHLSEIIKVEAEDDVETNFQKASCTLEAGVKIYSLRVDSVHSEAYKVLGGINRAGREDEQQETVVEGDSINGQEEGCTKKDLERKVSPISTLESSFDSLNVKKFDVAFSVDPLYHQTSAQFDEGGARGLLLNNLGVYGGCRVIFDSQEAPGKCMSCEAQCDKSDVIDLSFARECIEEMVTKMPTKNDISPTLGDIINQFDECNRRPSNLFSTGQKNVEHAEVISDNQDEFEDDTFENCTAWSFDHDDQSTAIDESSTYTDPIFPSQQENDPYIVQESDLTDSDDRFEKVAGFLFPGLGFTSIQNAWAGPDHWKYRKAKDPENAPVSEGGSPLTSKKTRSKKQVEVDINFTKSLEKEMPDIFVAPRNPKSLLLPANRVPCNTTLPEDCHYQPENLVKLFLLPNVLCFARRRGRKSSDESRQQGHGFEPSQEWENDSVFNGSFDDGNVHSDVEDSNSLVSQPRQVNKIEVQYDKTSKQVDVHVLKETLWDHIQDSTNMPEKGKETTVSFKQLLASFPDDCQAAAPGDISPHLCFICLLHLANEHGLSIRDCPSLDDLQINIPYVENCLVN